MLQGGRSRPLQQVLHGLRYLNYALQLLVFQRFDSFWLWFFALEDPSAPARSPEMVFQALAVAGVPYRRGGESPENGFDCSGLVAHVYREAFGIQLPHNARAQSQVGKRVS